jgi:nitrogen-specific signal transduction histidine kinase
VPVEVNAFIIRDSSGSPFALAMIARDISERKKLEAQLVQSQKMESVGRLAGGIAHDFNNILTAIIGYSELLLMQLAEANPMRHNIVSIRESADRAAALTNQLLAFSRQQVLEMQVVDLNGVIEGMFGMLRRMIGEDVTLDLRLAPKTRNVMADPGQISQVVMNLAVNARDAMPGGGKLTIATEDVDLPAAGAGGLELDAGAYVVLSVADTGHGMSEAVMGRIFDPFFTTKEIGKGTGLGLATAYGIVKQHNGHIAIESEVGAGSVFRIYLPVAAGETATMPAPKHINMPRGTETIMLVEDEPALLQLMTTIIGSLGYRVLTAADGNQALKIAEQHPGPVHVLLTDVIMPGMNGRTLADLFVKQHPETKVMFMSGYTEDFIAHHGVLEEGRVLVRKPLKPQDLAEKLREVLDRP